MADDEDEGLLQEVNPSRATSVNSSGSGSSLFPREIIILWDTVKLLQEQIKHTQDMVRSKDDQIQEVRTDLSHMKALNSSLQQELADVKTSNTSLQQEIAGVKTANTSLHQEIADVKTSNASLQQEIVGQQEKNVSMQERLVMVSKATEQLVDSSGEKWAKFDGIVEKMTTQLNDQTLMLNDLQQGQTTGNDRHEEQIRTMERKFAPSTTNMFNAVLSTTKELATGQMVKFDKCVGVRYDDSGLFYEESCCLRSGVDCMIVLAWILSQERSGELKTYMCVDGVDGKVYLGMTRCDADVCNGLLLLKLEAGRRVWLELKRVQGDARIRCCAWMGWVIGR